MAQKLKVQYPYTNKKQLKLLKGIRQKDLRDGVYQASITLDYIRPAASKAYDKYGTKFEDLSDKMILFN